MTESIFLASLFAILALTGVQPDAARPMKLCHVGVIADLVGPC